MYDSKPIPKELRLRDQDDVDRDRSPRIAGAVDVEGPLPDAIRRETLHVEGAMGGTKRMTSWMTWLALSGVGLAGCLQPNPFYCPDPVEGCTKYCEDAERCASTVGHHICDKSGDLEDDLGICVQCTAADTSACTGDTPLCVDNRCEPLPFPETCTQHAECSALSNVCLPEGRCADPSEVAYVNPSGTDNADCTLELPCKRILRAVETMRPFVKLTGTTDELVAITDGRTVTFLADPDARLFGAFTVGGNAHLRVFDLEIGRGGIQIPQFPVETTGTVEVTRAKLINSTISVARGSLTVTESVITGSSNVGITVQGGTTAITRNLISGNRGGILIQNRLFGFVGPVNFEISNNIIVNNVVPSPLDQAGGVTFDLDGGTHHFDFNTVAYNSNSNDTILAPGIHCGFTASHPFSGNLIYGNPRGGGSKPQVKGDCTWNDGWISPDGTNDPMFVDPAGGDFHLKPQSPLRNAANLNATIPIDFDGDVRPQDGRRDIGADEIRSM